MINKPNFFIVGTPRGGTTSLYSYLENHPEIYLPSLKEPHFFSVPEVLDTYYKTTIIEDENTYMNLYKDVKEQEAIGDLSTSYLFNKNSPERIKQFNPEARIIMVLRSPADRAISHYLMDYNLGYIDVPFFEVIKEKEKYSIFYREYIELGYYEAQIKNYYRFFDKSKILIVLSDELFSNPKKTISKVYNFIGVNNSYLPNSLEIYNQYSKPKFRLIKKINHSKTIKYILNNMPNGLKTKIKERLYTDKKKPELTKEKEFLKKMYKEDINETANFINRDLSAWI